jgi:DNA-binding protein WhiA
MSNPEKEYHFEVSATDQSLVRELSRLLEKSGLPVNTYQRKGSTVVYLKGAQQISDAMALMGATNSVFAMEDIRIRKQARGAANRAINCDEYNFQRMLDAADTQVEGIRRYVIVKGMRSLPPALQEIAQKRLDNADLSLVELGQLFEPPLSKSAVNHRMRRLMDIVREHEAQLIQEFSETQEEKP